MMVMNTFTQEQIASLVEAYRLLLGSSNQKQGAAAEGRNSTARETVEVIGYEHCTTAEVVQ